MDNFASKKRNIEGATNDLIHEGKKLANDLYEEGMSQMQNTQDTMKEYSDQLLRKVQQNPLTSILVASGVGFLLSLFFRK